MNQRILLIQLHTGNSVTLVTHRPRAPAQCAFLRHFFTQTPPPARSFSFSSFLPSHQTEAGWWMDMAAVPCDSQLQQTQPLCLFGIKYPQLSLSAFKRPFLSLMQNHENHHIMWPFSPQWLLSLYLLSPADRFSLFFLPCKNPNIKYEMKRKPMNSGNRVPPLQNMYRKNEFNSLSPENEKGRKSSVSSEATDMGAVSDWRGIQVIREHDDALTTDADWKCSGSQEQRGGALVTWSPRLFIICSSDYGEKCSNVRWLVCLTEQEYWVNCHLRNQENIPI